MVGRFSGVLSAAKPCDPLLPTVHSTSLYYFRDFLATCKIKATLCDVFKEPLLYLFYGRPSYRVASGAGARTDITYCPVCFVLKSRALSNVKRIFPFDTGAFYQGMYDPFLPKPCDVNDYLLGIKHDIPQRLVDFFFGTNRAYYFGEVRPHAPVPLLDFEVRGYYELISATGEARLDDRRYSIEIQSAADIFLSKANVLAIVLPTAALDERTIFEAINNVWKAIPIITYNTFRGTSPTEYHGVIREHLGRFLEAEGYL